MESVHAFSRTTHSVLEREKAAGSARGGADARCHGTRDQPLAQRRRSLPGRTDDAAESTTLSGEARFDLDDFRSHIVNDAYGRHLSACLFADEQVYRGFELAWMKTKVIHGTLLVRLWIDASALALHTLHWETLADLWITRVS